MVQIKLVPGAQLAESGNSLGPRRSPRQSAETSPAHLSEGLLPGRNCDDSASPHFLKVQVPL